MFLTTVVCGETWEPLLSCVQNCPGRLGVPWAQIADLFGTLSWFLTFITEKLDGNLKWAGFRDGQQVSSKRVAGGRGSVLGAAPRTPERRPGLLRGSVRCRFHAVYLPFPEQVHKVIWMQDRATSQTQSSGLYLTLLGGTCPILLAVVVGMLFT